MDKSCATQLLTTLNLWTDALEKDTWLMLFVFDFAKAVPRVRLLTKVESYGIAGNVLKW